jgi:hypothetical protein
VVVIELASRRSLIDKGRFQTQDAIFLCGCYRTHDAPRRCPLHRSGRRTEILVMAFEQPGERAPEVCVNCFSMPRTDANGAVIRRGDMPRVLEAPDLSGMLPSVRRGL